MTPLLDGRAWHGTGTNCYGKAFLAELCEAQTHPGFYHYATCCVHMLSESKQPVRADYLQANLDSFLELHDHGLVSSGLKWLQVPGVELILLGKRAKSEGPAAAELSARPQEARLEGDTSLPGELAAETEEPFAEGAVRKVLVNRYERDKAAREACIAHYGPSCVVCSFSFAATYGPVADGFIHVHHLTLLSEIGAEYEVDPVADLRPVCPNCHAVIHLGGGSRSIEEVRQLLKRG